MTVFCSVITCNFLAHARVLTHSVRRQYPDSRVAVLIVDDSSGSHHSEEFDSLVPSDLGIDRATLHEMALGYTESELCMALKPALCAHLLRETDDVVVFLDADMFVLSRLDALIEHSVRGGLVLTPHYLEPVPYRGLYAQQGLLARLRFQDDRVLLRYGQFNSGVFAVTRRAGPFLRWWDEWLRQYCVRELQEGLYTDQKWLDCVPVFFEHAVLRDAGYNVAVWNLHERLLYKEGHTYLCDGEPVTCFHFSKFEPSEMRLPPMEEPVTGVLAELCSDYSRALLEHGYREEITKPYGFGRTAAGLPIDMWMRRVCLKARSVDPESPIPDAFNPDGADAFLEWLQTPSTSHGSLSRYLAGVYEQRPDLRARFPDVSREPDASGFFDWVSNEGIPQVLLPDATPGAAGGTDETEALRERLDRVDAELRMLRSSRSVRYTAPFRRMSRILRQSVGKR